MQNNTISTKNMPTQKTNLFKVSLIMARSAWATLYACLAVLLRTLVGKCSRQNVDRLTHNWADEIFNIVGVKARIEDPYHFKLTQGRHYVIMSNHISHYDIPFIFKAFPGESIRMVAKKELFRIPIWGPAIRQAEFISIDRGDRKQAFKDLELAKQKMQSGIMIWIAPEGTRSRSGKLQEFKKGGFMLAMQTNAIIIPVGITRTNEILPPDTWNFKIGVEATLCIGSPIHAADYQNNRNGLMAEVEKSIRLATHQQME